MAAENPNVPTPDNINPQEREIPVKSEQPETPQAIPNDLIKEFSEKKPGDALMDIANGVLTNTSEGGSEQKQQARTEASKSFLEEMLDELEERGKKLSKHYRDVKIIGGGGAVALGVSAAAAVGAIPLGFVLTGPGFLVATGVYSGYEMTKVAIKVRNDRRERRAV